MIRGIHLRSGRCGFKSPKSGEILGKGSKPEVTGQKVHSTHHLLFQSGTIEQRHLMNSITQVPNLLGRVGIQTYPYVLAFPIDHF